MKGPIRKLLPWLLLTAAVLLLSAVAINSRHDDQPSSHGSLVQFHDVREQTMEFMGYYRSVSLTPEQEAIMEQALTAINAPCCSDETAQTCCCDCNMAKTWWGLSKHLIADQDFDADQVKSAVTEWLEFINPDGFTGNACYTARCNRPFREKGCGGMKEDTVVL